MSALSYRNRIVAVGCAAVLLFAAPPASAQNFLQRLFGGFHRAIQEAPPPDIRAFADPFSALARAISPPSRREETGPASAFCVRTCDGYHFVVRASAGASAADMCHAFCPASQTSLYSGSDIDYAAASDGSRYTDLDTAYEYRKQLVAGCTCNGRDVFGLARIDVTSDPTLRPGDVVATKDGLVAFTGSKDKVANFTPIESYAGFPKSYRDKLSAMKIAPNVTASGAITSSIPPASTNRNAAQ